MTIDIVSIHERIIDQYKSQTNEMLHIANEITHLKNIAKYPELLPYRGEQQIMIKINRLLDLQKQISTQESLHFYILQSTPLLESYKTLLNKPIKVSFMGKLEKPDTVEKDRIVKQYLTIASKYSFHDIGYVESDTIDETIPPCCDDPVIEYEYSNATCINCGKQTDAFESTFSYKDTERINIITKYTYARSIHFRDCINQFQGKQNSTISDDVYTKLIEQFRLHNLVNDDLPDPFQDVTKSHIYMFLREIEYPNHYEDVNLIYRHITGKVLDDISHLEAILIKDFDILNALYDEKYIKTKIIDRKNFINTKYVLYQLLRRHKYPCKKEDFQLLKTNERKAFHDEICAELFKQLGWNFSAIF
jgi:hypothetical protein